MNNGLPGIQLLPDEAIAAPRSGVAFGRAGGGPVQLRLFRPTGTRLVLGTGLAPVQLLVLRASAATVPVDVITTRRRAWEALLPAAPGARLRGPSEPPRPGGGPALLVDDRPLDPGARAGSGPADARPWQCRVEVRGEWHAAEPAAAAAALRGFAAATLTVLARLPQPAAERVVTVFGLPRGSVEALSSLGERSFALLRRGHIGYVTIDPNPGEDHALGRAALS
jgi:hypothetical protein